MKTISLLSRTAILTWMLSPGLRADITVTGSGVLSLGDSATISFNGGTLNVQNGAQVIIQPGASLTGTSIMVGATGRLVNCGTITANISNSGEIVSDCGGNSVFLGNVTNSGVFRVSHGSTLIALGTFHNNPGALLDMITADQTGPPSSLTGEGTVIEAKDVQVEGFEVNALATRIVIEGIPPHTYQLFGRAV